MKRLKTTNPGTAVWKALVAAALTVCFVGVVPAEALRPYAFQCPHCLQHKEVSSESEGYAWFKSHLKYCQGEDDPDSPSPQPVSGPMRPSGFLFLGATAGSAITGVISLAKGAAAPEILKSAGEGAFYGGVAAGLLWIVQGFADAAISYSPNRSDQNWRLVTVADSFDRPCTGLGMRVLW